MVAQMWPNITAAVSDIVKTTVEPMFKTMLPGPLSSLHFTKIDLGTVPLKIDGVLATKTDTGSIKLDMNVHWDGECDIQLDGSMIPSLVSMQSPCEPAEHFELTYLARVSRA